MIIKRFAEAVSISGIAILLLASSSASAATVISYTTAVPGTEFVDGVNNVTLDSNGGQAATLTFNPNGSSGTGVPSNVDLGDFLLVCLTCTESQTTTFGSFIFDLVVSDTTDGATGEFVGTSPGGTVSSDSGTIQVNWQSPLTIGPGTTNVLTGSFGSTHFDMVSPVSLVPAPNSGTPPGDVTVQGQVGAVTPEPATFGLVGGALLAAAGVVRRRKALRA
jgi:hypothetical protein